MSHPKSIVVQSTTGRHLTTVQAPSWKSAAKRFAAYMTHHPTLTTYGVNQIKSTLAVVTVGPRSQRNPGLCCLPS